MTSAVLGLCMSMTRQPQRHAGKPRLRDEARDPGADHVLELSLRRRRNVFAPRSLEVAHEPRHVLRPPRAPGHAARHPHAAGYFFFV
jgi:hypothetical protein